MSDLLTFRIEFIDFIKNFTKKQDRQSCLTILKFFIDEVRQECLTYLLSG